jgi:hypothetical protein
VARFVQARALFLQISMGMRSFILQTRSRPVLAAVAGNVQVL